MDRDYVEQSIAIDDLVVDVDAAAREYKELCDLPTNEELRPGGYFSVISEGTANETHVYYTDPDGNNIDVTTGIRGLTLKVNTEDIHARLSLDVICFDIPDSRYSMVFKNLVSENTEIVSLYDEADRGDEEVSLKLALALAENKAQAAINKNFDCKSLFRDSDYDENLPIQGYALGSNMPVLAGNSAAWFLYANEQASKSEVAMSYHEWNNKNKMTTTTEKTTDGN